MSNLKKGEWSDIFDSLYYNFINQNQTKLLKLYYTVNNWKKKDNKKEILNKASEYLNKYI